MKTIVRLTRSTTVRTLGLATAALVASATAGCAVQADGSPKQGAAAEERNPGANLPVREDYGLIYAFSQEASADTFQSADMGASSGRTCFLAGVTGSIVAAQFPEQNTQAGVTVDVTNGEYALDVQAGEGNLKGFARCVNSTAGRTAAVTWHSGQSALSLGDVTATRQCYLTGIQTSTVYPPQPSGFTATKDLVKVWNDGSKWYVGGDVKGWAWATARCMDVNTFEGVWDYDWESTTQLNGELTDTSGSNCFLQGLGGNFEFNTGYEQGAYISRDSGLNQFYLNEKTPAVNGVDTTVWGYAACAR